MTLSERLNLPLALRKTKRDLNNRNFINHPYLTGLIDLNEDDWIRNVREEIADGTYHPNPCVSFDIPKPNWHIRPGAVLSIKDSLIYSSLILDAIGEIRDHIHWSADSKRFSYILHEGQLGNSWFEFGVQKWMHWVEESRRLYESGNDYVLFTDISGFYENIDIGTLLSDLETVGMRNDTRQLLSTCLNIWAGQRSRGIPQGYSPSDILSEIYLNNIDRKIVSNGMIHIRYSDDMRIFSNSREDLIDALHKLTRFYRERGLNLQTSKSVICHGAPAINKILGRVPSIQELHRDIANELRDGIAVENPYMGPAEMREMLDELHINIDLISLTQAFNQYTEQEEEFDKSLFHFFLNRFGALRNPHMIDYCIDIYDVHPEELLKILMYFSNFADAEPIHRFLHEIIRDSHNPFPYNRYLIAKWYWENRIRNEEVIQLMRYLLQEQDVDKFTKYYCIAYLGDFGNPADLEIIQSLYPGMEDELSRVTIICGLHNMAPGRRNTFIGRMRGESVFIDSAIIWARQN